MGDTVNSEQLRRAISVTLGDDAELRIGGWHSAFISSGDGRVLLALLDAYDEAQAEIARLRAALQHLNDVADTEGAASAPSFGRLWGEVKSIAALPDDVAEQVER